jgi:hypothetical protein
MPRLLSRNISIQYENLAEVRNNEEYNRRDIISQKLKTNDYIYILIHRHDKVSNHSSGFIFPKIKEELANEIINNNSEIKTFAKAGHCNNVAEVIYFLFHLYLFNDCNYPEQYQHLSKFTYDIQNKSLEELQNIFPDMTSKEKQFAFQSVRLNYLDYLFGNYYRVINDQGLLSIDPKIDITDDLQLVISMLASPIINITMNYIEELPIHLIDKCSAFVVGLRDLIDQAYDLLNSSNNANPIQKWNATIKKITPYIKECNQDHTIALKPKFNEKDDFYLVAGRKHIKYY